jgi:peptidoglycan hydrolase CwlO-like protein
MDQHATQRKEIGRAETQAESLQVKVQELEECLSSSESEQKALQERLSRTESDGKALEGILDEREEDMYVGNFLRHPWPLIMNLTMTFAHT